LKPENILLDSDGHIVITDFGLSKEVFDDYTDTFCGTPEYLAPEVLQGGGHTFPVDWWSLGTLIYEMIVGLPPFYSKSISVMYQKILEGPLRFPEGMSEDAMDLLEGLLERDPDERLNGEDLKEHPFFDDVDWDKLETKKNCTTMVTWCQRRIRYITHRPTLHKSSRSRISSHRTLMVRRTLRGRQRFLSRIHFRWG